MNQILNASVLYAGTVFGIGFLLGVVRVFLFAPLLGELGAVLLELPIILTASGFLARYGVTRYRLAAAMQRLAMGGLAFALLMLLEIALTLLTGGSMAGWPSW